MIAHDNAIDASCVSSPHSVQDREVDVLMYPGQLSVRAIAITNLSDAACTFAIDWRMFVCLFGFVCLFVWGKTRKSILRSLSLEGSNNPWEFLQTESART